jgi:predicted nucleic acid-binding protein
VTLSTANLAILDTSVYIDNLRSGRFKQEILDLKFVVRCSAVVLAELLSKADHKGKHRGSENYFDSAEKP